MDKSVKILGPGKDVNISIIDVDLDKESDKTNKTEESPPRASKAKLIKKRSDEKRKFKL